jgi:hypothetical protein
VRRRRRRARTGRGQGRQSPIHPILEPEQSAQWSRKKPGRGVELSNSAGSSTTAAPPADCSHEPEAEPTPADCSYVPEAESDGEKELGSRDPAAGRDELKGQWRARGEENPDLVPDGSELAGAERLGRRPPRAQQATSSVARHGPFLPTNNTLMLSRAGVFESECLVQYVSRSVWFW